MKRKENVVIIVVLVLMLVAIIGVSYAAFSFSKLGTKVNTITTGSITMTYEETDNTISLNGALPTTDKTGMVRLNPGEYFDFSISSEITGNVNINYEISAKEVGEGTIDGKYIKLYLTELVGGKEEALMLPEVYNEETSSNTYTGRPANEMSLYTSSMNSSEEHQYRLRMYVDESYNPQGDGGGLTFTVQVNVYGKAGDKYVPLTTQEILEDNELQEETTNMFNYASNGSYISSFDFEQGPQYGSEPSQVTNGLYSSEDEDGTSYYFRGAVENNNVQFGEYKSDYYVYMYQLGADGMPLYFQSLESCEEYKNYVNDTDSNSCTQVKLANAGDKMYWKIIRVNGDGSLRLIYNGTSATPDNSNLQNSYIISSHTEYNIDDVYGSKIVGYTYDRNANETDSFIKKEVDTWYKNALGNTVYDSKVIAGRFCSDSSGYREETMIGGNVFASFDRLASVLGELIGLEMQENVTPTLKCPSTTESYGGSYRLKAGLITADELVFAGESYNVVGNSYLTPGSWNDSIYNYWGYWTMTPGFFSTDVENAEVFVIYNNPGLFTYDNGSMKPAIRPVINVTTDNGFTSGDGTASNPYVLS